jgi:hypothetical protein
LPDTIALGLVLPVRLPELRLNASMLKRTKRCPAARLPLKGCGPVQMAVCQNLVPLVNIKIAGKWMFIPLKMALIGIDPYPNELYELTVEIYAER